MTFVKRVCRKCGCRTSLMTDCGIDGCDLNDRPDLPLLDALHDHCIDHPTCSAAGCDAERVPLSKENAS